MSYIEDSEERRKSKEWELNDFCPQEGRKAHALFEHLKNSGQIDDEYKVDVYNVIPEEGYGYYDMTEFTIIDAGLDGEKYAVGDEYETEESAKEYVIQLLDDIGYKGFTESFVMNFLDVNKIYGHASDMYYESISMYPDNFIDESLKDLSREQQNEVDTYEYKIEKTKKEIEMLINFYGKTYENIEFLESKIEEYQVNIIEITENPEGEYSDEVIENKVEEFSQDAKNNPYDYIKNNELEIDYFVDKEEFIQRVIDQDGYEMLSRYDGEVHEVKILNELFYIIRVD